MEKESAAEQPTRAGGIRTDGSGGKKKSTAGRDRSDVSEAR